MKYIIVFVLFYIFSGCSSKEESLKKDNLENEVSGVQKELLLSLEDLENIPQNVEHYTKYLLNDTNISHLQNDYEKQYFSVWNYQKPVETVEQVSWPFKRFDHTNSYGENLLPLSEDFFDEMLAESNFEHYLTLSGRGVALYHSNLRAMPTVRPVLRDPKIAGEGFPFDYLQNSSINANTPIFVSHYSKNKQWMFVFTSFAYGWIKSNEVVFLEEQYIKRWQNAQQVTLTKDGVALFDTQEQPLFDSRLGMHFPIIKEHDDGYTVLIVTSYADNVPMYKKAKISKEIAAKRYLKFTRDNINRVVNELKKSNYGWGGMYNQRDCSSTLMDMYATFGIWLPRNSYKQSLVGAVLDISSLDNENKIRYIKDNGIPFETFLYKKGHIVLYVGTYNDTIVVFQNMWGIRTKKSGVEGRHIVGRTVFSTLKLGDELKYYDKDKELLKDLKSMNNITR